MYYYVYQLIDPRTNVVFYIGKGKNNRMYVHESYVKRGKLPNGNKKLFDKINEIKNENLSIIYKKIFESDNEHDTYEYENRMINEFGINNLCNIVDDRLLIGMCDNTKGSNWYYNEKTSEYRLFKLTDDIPDGFLKGSPKTKMAMEKWWSNLSEDDLNIYKFKMSRALKSSKKHKDSIQSEEYRMRLSNGLLNSERFKEYNKSRTKRGKYNSTEKIINRRKKSAIIGIDGEIIKGFQSLKEVAEYFNIKISTACVWIKAKKKINDNSYLTEL